MNYKNRVLSDKLSRLVDHFSVVVVCGARQVGKSTLIAHQFPDWDAVVFDPVIDVGNARRDPELFLSNHPSPLILDEIQYCPEVVSCIKRAVDRDKKPGMYILTGSQQWSVMKSISESLAGRAVFIDLEGFMLAEINESIPSASWLERYLDNPQSFVKEKHKTIALKRTIYDQLWRGWLPEMDGIPEDLADDYFSAYIRTYIERDVRQLLDVSDWQQFGRFVQLMGALSAQEMNFSQLGRDIGVTPQTARRWLTVLKATFQWYEIPAYHINSIKKISSTPKGYFSDTGLICNLCRISSAGALGGHPMCGSIFESAVVAEIRKMIAVLSRKPEIYHWRLHSGSEVDIILERDDILYPIEIKLKSRPSKKDARGITALRRNYPNKMIAAGLIVAPVEEFEQVTELDYAVPWNLG